MCNHDTTIGQAIRSKIKAMGIKQSVAMRMIAKHCNCSPITVYGWINDGRPLRKYLPGISNALNLRESRLQNIWLGTSVAAKANDVMKVNNTFTPNADDLQVAVNIVKLGRHRRDNVMKLVEVLELGRTIA